MKILYVRVEDGISFLEIGDFSGVGGENAALVVKVDDTLYDIRARNDGVVELLLFVWNIEVEDELTLWLVEDVNRDFGACKSDVAKDKDITVEGKKIFEMLVEKKGLLTFREKELAMEVILKVEREKIVGSE